MKPTQIRRGRTIHRETGTTFYYATRLLPARVRDEVYVLYGFFRLADEVVDEGVEIAERVDVGGLGEDDRRGVRLDPRTVREPITHFRISASPSG